MGERGERRRRDSRSQRSLRRRIRVSKLPNSFSSIFRLKLCFPVCQRNMKVLPPTMFIATLRLSSGGVHFHNIAIKKWASMLR